MLKELPFDKNYLLRCLALLAFMIILMKATGGAGFIVSFVFLYLSVSRNDNEMLLFTIMVTIVITLSNSNIINKGGLFILILRLLLLTISVIMINRMEKNKMSLLLTPFLVLFAYLLYMIIPSTFGWCPMISYFKLFFFSMSYFAYCGIANNLVTSQVVNTYKVRSIFLMVSIYFIIGSLLLIPLGIGYLSGEEILNSIKAGKEVVALFKGISLHSQTLGPICAMLGIMLYADLIFSIRYFNKIYIFLLLCIPFLIWKTSSRTAMGAFFVGITFATFCFSRERSVAENWKNKVTSIMMIIIIVLCGIILSLPHALDKATNFILKSRGGNNQQISFDNIAKSRRSSWDSAMHNFMIKPITGNGFQVSEEMQGNRTTSSTIEKGVWIAAVLEESGIIGMIIFLFYVTIVFSSLYRNKCYQGLCAFFMIILINMGEFTLFSITSLGGFLWAMVFLGIIFDAQRRKYRHIKLNWA